MEKEIITSERYKVSDQYYVDVREEVAGTGERDYWLCSRQKDVYVYEAVSGTEAGGGFSCRPY